MTDYTELYDCADCGEEKAGHEFYWRKLKGGNTTPYSYCKDCYKERSRNQVCAPRNKSTVVSEALAIAYLRSKGIPAHPGKVFATDYVDVIALASVWIEVKYSVLKRRRTATPQHKFSFTPAQLQRGVHGDLIMLICDDEERNEANRTFHLLPKEHPVFYMKGRLKTGLTFTPGAMQAKKHGNNRVVMTQPIMDSHQDRIDLVWYVLMQQRDRLIANPTEALHDVAA